MKYDIVICTPTFNRSYTLTKLYNSLVEQTLKKFYWLVIDDGSTDNTKELILSFQKEGKIHIEYLYQKNQGKHVALNLGIETSNTEYFAIVDSDDYLLPNAIEKIDFAFNSIRNLEGFAGISYNRGYSPTELIGNTFTGDYIDATNIQRKKFNILGDKFEVFYTKILKENKFPVFEGEKFLPEIIVWTRIAAKGLKLRWYNEIIYIGEYLDDGLTKSNEKLIRNNPKGYALRIKEQVALANITLKERLGYFSSYYYARKNNENIINIAKEMDCSLFMLCLAIFSRKVLNTIR
ncbi:MAG: glycosyltransferase family 2 protein [[Actinobacillus] rossii]|nr:glycosyltransferase family 2 protein [[Actinobacillus] rossii]MDY5792912.1 glycosyltransferase family 2 protein [[Actinobacillus] rossii]